MSHSDAYKERSEWFMSRIGKTVFRNDNGCPCKSCQRIYVEGIAIDDEFHATYLRDVEGDEGRLMYFDTRPEALAYELSLNTERL